ncbi:beta-hydroxydecanoyl-ACP dehydratase [Streptomyces sp. NPDC058471]|uniref:beta-hydroxydecanoyl-ACP dehydratase n=1 Tax=Streptomyces sp. NPDC058471 TaxID=3346516 RepID=UPI003654B9C4
MTTPDRVFARDQLEELSHAPVSQVFGPRYAIQDDRARQTRPPKPPLLLIDEVTGLEGTPGTLGASGTPCRGSIRTRTFVRPDRSFVDHTARMYPGLTIESTQSLLVLLSWLGADLDNDAQRVFRLLGYEATFHGAGAPLAGETSVADVRILDHARQDESLIVFFEADCRVADELRLTIRNAQAGYFSYQELAAAPGVRWTPSRSAPPPGRAAPTALSPRSRAFGPTLVRAFADGRAAHCFGPDWPPSGSPRLPSGDMLLLGDVTEFAPSGGPWARGYLRAETLVQPDAWYFAAHFHHDPVMPGNLTLDGCLQAMSFHLAASGFTIGRDHWRFEAVPGHPFVVRFRGQVTPAANRVTYEVFASHLVTHPYPTLIADVLVTVDGLKALHAERLAVRLAPCGGTTGPVGTRRAGK